MKAAKHPCGDILRKLLEKAGITQAYLAWATGYSEGYISQLVTGKGRISYHHVEFFKDRLPEVDFGELEKCLEPKDDVAKEMSKLQLAWDEYLTKRDYGLAKALCEAVEAQAEIEMATSQTFSADWTAWYVVELTRRLVWHHIDKGLTSLPDMSIVKADVLARLSGTTETCFRL